MKKEDIIKEFKNIERFWMDTVDHYRLGVLEVEETEDSKIQLVHYFYKTPKIIAEFKLKEESV